MAKKTASDVPARSTVFKLAKQIEVKRAWIGSEESEAARKAADARESELFKDPLLKKLRAKADMLEKKAQEAAHKHNEARSKLIQRVQLEPITPELVREVRKMLGLSVKLP